MVFSPRTPLVLAAALALAACSTLQAPTAPDFGGVTAPAAWAEAAASAPQRGATDLAAWWRRFGDSTLDRLIADALAANTDIAQARANLRQARALADVQAAQLLPALSAGASAQRGKSGAQPTSNTLRAELDASWEVDVFGGKRSSANASAIEAQSSAAALGDVQVSVTAETALAYISLRSSLAREATAQRNLTSQQETLQITQWRVQAGLATSLEAEQARAAVEQTRSQLPLLQKAAAQARHQLALLTGRSIDQLTLDAGSDIPAAPADLALAFPADTLRQRADVRTAELRTGAAAQRVVQADAARYPSFTLSGSLGLSALTLSGLSGGAAVVNSLLAGLSLPIFDAGAGKAQVRAQDAAYDSAVEAYRGAVLTALKDVEDALVALQRDRERLDTLRLAAQAADNAALLARQRYSGGVVDFQTVLETQRSQLSAQDSVASASADVAADHVRLYKSLGGGWRPEEVAAATTGPR